MNIKDLFQECEKHCAGSKTTPNNIEKSENLVIQGDNLDVLKKLSLIYSESVNLIYIDPHITQVLHHLSIKTNLKDKNI